MTKREHTALKAKEYSEHVGKISGTASGFGNIESAYKHGYLASEIDMLRFAEWAGEHFIRLNGVWVHRYNDQTDKANWIKSDKLYKMYCDEQYDAEPKTEFINFPEKPE